MKCIKKFKYILYVTSICLLGGCNTNKRDDKEICTETRILVEENIKESRSKISAKGIETSSISLNNPLFMDAINNIEKPHIENEGIVNPEEIEHDITVYIDEAYDNRTKAYIEPEYEYIEETTISDSNVNYVGNYIITAYTWTGNTMANGEWPYIGSVASSDFPIGTEVYIEGIGMYTVRDVCPTSGVMDIYMDTYDACINFGRQYANVYIIN